MLIILYAPILVHIVICNDVCAYGHVISHVLSHVISHVISHVFRRVTCHVSRVTYTDDNFRIIGQARSSCHISVLESVYIKTQNPVLCELKDFIFSLGIFK